MERLHLVFITHENEGVPMDHKEDKSSLADPDSSGESSTDSRREFLKKVGRQAAKGAAVAPAVALLMAADSKPAAADVYDDEGCGGDHGGGCGCGCHSIL